MDDAFRVRGTQPVRDASCHHDGLPPRHGPPRQSHSQAFALEQLDDGDRLAVDDGQLVNRHHVLVRERRDGARLMLESSPHFGIAREMSGEHLERDVTAQPGIVRTVDFSHTAGTDECLHFVLRDASTWSE